MTDGKGKCKHEKDKLISDNWGVRKDKWCKYKHQFLTPETCVGCLDFKEAD